MDLREMSKRYEQGDLLSPLFYLEFVNPLHKNNNCEELKNGGSDPDI
jgi:hypothetical protein